MRLREPFAGYKLSSGHALFHIAYILGSQYAYHHVLPPGEAKDLSIYGHGK